MIVIIAGIVGRLLCQPMVRRRWRRWLSFFERWQNVTRCQGNRVAPTPYQRDLHQFQCLPHCAFMIAHANDDVLLFYPRIVKDLPECSANRLSLSRAGNLLHSSAHLAIHKL